MNDDIGGKKQSPVYVSETENELTDHEEDSSDTDDESPPVSRDAATDDNQTIYVFPTNNKGGKRKYDKKDSCLYCKSMIGSTNLMKHLLRRHQSEEDVVQLMTLPCLSLARKKHMQILRNRGNFEHNVIVLKQGGGLLVCNRPSNRKDISENIDSYCACSNCFGFYSKREISKHQCPSKRSARPERILPSGLGFSNERPVQQFFDRLIDDKVKRVAMTDPTIVEFVKQQLDLKGFAAFSTIANKVRLLSEVLSNYRSKLCNETASVEDLLRPEGMVGLQETVKDMFNYQLEGQISMERPSALMRLTQTLSQIIGVLKVDALRKVDWSQVKIWNAAPSLLEFYLTPLARNAHKMLKSHACGVPQDLPDVSTIQTFSKYLDSFISQTERTRANHSKIAKAVLARLLLFNKRRSSEVAKIKKSDWEKRGNWKENALKDFEALDETEKVMVKTSEILYVVGKGRKHVPVIFPPHLVSAVKWLAMISHNEFIFPNRAEGHLRGHDTIREMVKNSGIDSRLTSTKFRKLAATVLQVSDSFFLRSSFLVTSRI